MKNSGVTIFGIIVINIVIQNLIYAQKTMDVKLTDLMMISISISISFILAVSIYLIEIGKNDKITRSGNKIIATSLLLLSKKLKKYSDVDDSKFKENHVMYGKTVIYFIKLVKDHIIIFSDTSRAREITPVLIKINTWILHYDTKTPNEFTQNDLKNIYTGVMKLYNKNWKKYIPLDLDLDLTVDEMYGEIE